MDKFIAIILIITTTMSVAHSQEYYTHAHEYTLEPTDEVQCDWVDVAAGTGTAIVSGTLIGISTVANTMVSTGGVVGYAAALTAPVLGASTVPTAIIGTVVFGALLGVPAWGMSCYLRN